MAFNLDDYEPVADRIERFWKDHPEGAILTDLVHQDDKRFIVKAFVHRGDRLPDATGYAEEIIGSTNVNRTSALENCETSAIGRALANLGYAVKGQRASREEMAKTQTQPRPRSGGQKRTPSPQPQESHEKPPEDDSVEAVAAYARELAGRFTQWSEAERADSYKRHSKAELDGKPLSKFEVLKVAEAMREEYYNLHRGFPVTLP